MIQRMIIITMCHLQFFRQAYFITRLQNKRNCTFCKMSKVQWLAMSNKHAICFKKLRVDAFD